MIFNKHWEMPNSNTFDIRCIKAFIERYNDSNLISIDPFANKNRIAKITNDIDPSMDTTYHLDAHEFLKQFEDKSIDIVLFDPPYSPRQISECYKKLGLSVNMQTTQSSFWSKLKDEISRIVKPGGIVLSFGWNSGGVGKKRGFEMLEIMLVAHGGQHNDTICTAEIKL
jgi:predicted methyltransferase